MTDKGLAPCLGLLTSFLSVLSMMRCQRYLLSSNRSFQSWRTSTASPSTLSTKNNVHYALKLAVTMLLIYMNLANALHNQFSVDSGNSSTFHKNSIPARMHIPHCTQNSRTVHAVRVRLAKEKETLLERHAHADLWRSAVRLMERLSSAERQPSETGIGR